MSYSLDVPTQETGKMTDLHTHYSNERLAIARKATALYSRQEIANARKVMRSFGCSSLLTRTDTSCNPKTKKNNKVNVLTAPLHLAPAKTSGFQICPMASPACKRLCLNTAGNPAYAKGKKKARIARTRFFHLARKEFFIVLYAEMRKHAIKALSKDMKIGFRPNATSDISWEIYNLPKTNHNIFEEFSEATLYDYTKIKKRMIQFLRGEMPNNYHLTFSATENNWDDCIEVLGLGGTVAMAFDIPRSKPMIEEYEGYEVIDGDEHDYLPSAKKGRIIGLRAKGKAIGDTSGFVRRVWKK